MLAEWACRSLVLRAAALADAGQADGLAALFTPDALLTRPNGVALRGREAIARAYHDRPAHRITAHLVCGTLFDAVGAHQARATSHVLLWVGDARTACGPKGRAAEAQQIVGRFIDHFVADADGWRIAERVACFDLHTPAGPT
ncbi:MAG: nuclear transport factor 2 family protein [Aquabacterium sp.]|nr:nuclear transport factor 2 family protein [Aquabacterium sp.]